MNPKLKTNVSWTGVEKSNESILPSSPGVQGLLCWSLRFTWMCNGIIVRCRLGTLEEVQVGY